MEYRLFALRMGACMKAMKEVPLLEYLINLIATGSDVYCIYRMTSMGEVHYAPMLRTSKSNRDQYLKTENDAFCVMGGSSSSNTMAYIKSAATIAFQALMWEMVQASLAIVARLGPGARPRIIPAYADF